MPKLVHIKPDPDKVEVAGQEVKRPDHISTSEWLRFWELIQRRAWGAY